MPEIPKIISVDDHVIEPPNVWQDRLPGEVQGRSGPGSCARKVKEMTFVGGVFSLRGGRRRTRTARGATGGSIEDLQYPLDAPVGRGRLPARRDHGQPDHDGRHAQGLLGARRPASRTWT